ncbi:putative F-box protein [Raphanus sativus]|uniref:F-box protein At4g10190 n=1 Tax=Raphanus sativus TaxID=3726 RepID=A0A6J0LZ26_RAPSA|nr:putative F-box protein At4g10190 [Raphanus sativus]KAJ4894185.1 putative F-box protein [Raphanus sativus]
MTKKEEKRRNTIDLPDDLLVEILSRVPDASLARFRSSSKGWNSLIKKEGRLAMKSLVAMLTDDRVYFARLDLHSTTDVNVVKVISQFSLNGYPLSNCSEEVYIHDVFHCDGLLLCTTTDEKLVVWNPCSGETSRIIKPLNSKRRSDTYAFGKSSCNNEYKILRVYHSGDGWMSPCLVKYEIYDFTSNSWRVLGEARGWTLPGPWRRGTSVDGNTYWLSFDFSQDRQRPKNTLRYFDYSTERFGLVSLPGDPLSYHPFVLSVTREEQKLCLLTSCDKLLHIAVWMATKIIGTGDMSWSKLLTVKRTSSDQFFKLCKGMSFLADRENKVIVHPIKDMNCSNLLHIVGEDKYRKVKLCAVGYARSASCAPTLVQIQQGSSGVGTWKAPITKFS